MKFPMKRRREDEGTGAAGKTNQSTGQAAFKGQGALNQASKRNFTFPSITWDHTTPESPPYSATGREHDLDTWQLSNYRKHLLGSFHLKSYLGGWF